MATSPLAKYKEAAKSFNVTDDKNVPPVIRLGFAREQAEQMKHIANRLLFDLATTQVHLEKATDPGVKSAYQNKANQYENDLRQTSSSLDVVLVLVKELENEVEAEG